MIKKFTSLLVACFITTVYAFATPPCTVSFTTDIDPANFDTVCMGVPVTFTNTSDVGGETLSFKQWNFGDGTGNFNQENITHTFIQAGTYIVQFSRGSNSCPNLSAQRTIYVINPPLGMAFSSDACFQVCTGTATADIQIAPHGDYNFLWSDGQITNPAENLCPATYSVTVSDDYGCSTDFTGVVVNEADEIVVDAGSDIYICEGSQWPITASVLSGGIGSLDYLWTPNAFFDPTQLNAVLDVDEQSDFGTYTLTVTDDDGCTGSDEIEVIPTPGSISGTITDPDNGSGMDNVLVSLIKRGGVNSLWEVYDTYTSAGGGMFQFMNLPFADYLIKAEMPGSTDYMPVYYHVTDTVFDWQQAQITIVGCGEMITNTDFTLVHAPGDMGGNCAFQGTVYLVNGCLTPPCKTQTEDPIPLIDVVVKKTPPGNAVAWTLTSDGGVNFPGLDSGEFRISNMPLSQGDTFSFVVNIPGLGMMNNYAVVVVFGDSLQDNLNFYVDADTGGGIWTYNPLGVEVLHYTRKEMFAYPNPFNDKCELKFTNTPGSKFNFTLFDVTGKAILRETEQEGTTYTIQTGKIEQGIYIAEVTTEDEVFRTRIMKK